MRDEAVIGGERASLRLRSGSIAPVDGPRRSHDAGRETGDGRPGADGEVAVQNAGAGVRDGASTNHRETVRCSKPHRGRRPGARRAHVHQYWQRHQERHQWHNPPATEAYCHESYRHSLSGTHPSPLLRRSAGRGPKAGRARRAMTWRFLRDGCVRHEFSEAHLWLIRLSQISSSREGPMQQPPPGRGRDSSNPTIRSKRGQRSDYRVVVAMAMTAMPTATRSPTVSMMVVVASRRIIPARRSVRVWRRGARAGAADIGMGARDSATALSGGDVQVSGPGQVCTSDSPHVFRIATHRRRVGAPARDAASLRVWPHVRRYAGAERMSVQK